MALGVAHRRWPPGRPGRRRRRDRCGVLDDAEARLADPGDDERLAGAAGRVLLVGDRERRLDLAQLLGVRRRALDLQRDAVGEPGLALRVAFLLRPRGLRDACAKCSSGL
jgi:hypothetical protein